MAEVARDERSDLVVRNVGEIGPVGSPMTLHLVTDQHDRAVGLEEVIDRIGDGVAVDAVEGLPEGDGSAGPDPELADVLGDVLDKGDVFEAAGFRPTSCLGEHPGLWVQSDNLGEEVGEFDRQHAWPAPDIEQSPGAVEAELLA